MLCYHGVRARTTSASDVPFGPLHVSEDELGEHCAVLTKYAHPIGLDVWLDALEGRSRFPDRAVLVTFDDGYRSVSTLGKPILESFDIPAVVFVSTEAVRAQTFFWHDAVALAEGEETVDAWKSLAFDELNGRRRECQDRMASRFSTDHPLAPLSLVCPEFVAGSHLWNRMFTPLKFVDHRPYDCAFERFEDLPDIEAKRGDYEIVSWTLEPGDAIAFHMKTVHGAPGTATHATRRLAIATRWLGDDAVFAEWPVTTSRPFPGLDLEPGDPMEHELFPMVVSRS